MKIGGGRREEVCSGLARVNLLGRDETKACCPHLRGIGWGTPHSQAEPRANAMSTSRLQTMIVGRSVRSTVVLNRW
jgi:hypothetical protein